MFRTPLGPWGQHAPCAPSGKPRRPGVSNCVKLEGFVCKVSYQWSFPLSCVSRKPIIRDFLTKKLMCCSCCCCYKEKCALALKNDCAIRKCRSLILYLPSNYPFSFLWLPSTWSGTKSASGSPSPRSFCDSDRNSSSVRGCTEGPGVPVAGAGTGVAGAGVEGTGAGSGA